MGACCSFAKGTCYCISTAFSCLGHALLPCLQPSDQLICAGVAQALHQMQTPLLTALLLWCLALQLHELLRGHAAMPYTAATASSAAYIFKVSAQHVTNFALYIIPCIGTLPCIDKCRPHLTTLSTEKHVCHSGSTRHELKL